MSPEDRAALSEVYAHADQWAEEIMAQLPGLAADGRLVALARHLTDEIVGSAKLPEGERQFLAWAGPVLGLIGLARVLEAYHRREEGEMD